MIDIFSGLLHTILMFFRDRFLHSLCRLLGKGCLECLPGPPACLPAYLPLMEVNGSYLIQLATIPRERLGGDVSHCGCLALFVDTNRFSKARQC